MKGDAHYWYDVVGATVIANAIANLLTDRLDENIMIIPILDVGKLDFGTLARIQF